MTPTARSDAYQVAVGDLNHDGFGDLAVADVNGVDALDNPTPGIDVFLEPDGGGDIPAAASDFMSPIPVIEKYHDRIVSLHLKDRTAEGRNLTWVSA